MSFFGSLWNGIKSIGSSLLGGIGSSVGQGLIGGVSSAVSNKQQMKYQKELMALQNKYNKSAAKDSYNYSLALQRNANNWNYAMSSTAHQIEVNDLRKAGLNPILSATGGSGAPVVGASNATLNEQGVSGASAPEVDYLSSALAMREQRNNDRRTDSDTWLSRKQANYFGELGRNEAEKFDSIVQDRKNSIATTKAQVNYWNQLARSAEMDSMSNRISSLASAEDVRLKRNANYYERSNVSPLYNTGKQLFNDIYNFMPKLGGSIKPPKTGTYTFSFKKGR